MASACGNRIAMNASSNQKLPINKILKQKSMNIDQTEVRKVQKKQVMLSIPETVDNNVPCEKSVRCEMEKMHYQENRLSNQYPPSRIPTLTQNFNQISKTATTLWNGIYERHLLNQTKFECNPDEILANNKRIQQIPNIRHNNASGVNNTIIPRSDANFNFNNHLHQNEMLQTPAAKVKNREQNLTEIGNATMTKIIRNRLLNQVKNSSGIEDAIIRNFHENPNDEQHYLISHDKNPNKFLNFNATKNELQIPSEMHFMCKPSNIIEMNGHNKQFNRKMRTTSCHMYKTNGIVSQANNFSGIGNVHLERGQPVGGNHCEDSATTNTLSVISAVNAKIGCNTFTNAITTSGGESTSATNSEYTAQSKINLMLETAQAMAAAAYFARLVMLHK